MKGLIAFISTNFSMRQLSRLLLLVVTLLSCKNGDDESPSLAASIEGEHIGMHEIDALVQPEMYESLFNTYYARRKVLDEIIAGTLLNKRAGSLGITRDSLEAQILNDASKEGGIEKFIKDNFLSDGLVDPERFGAKVALNSERGKRIFDQMFRSNALEKYVSKLKNQSKVEVYIFPPLSPAVDLSLVDYNSLNSPAKKVTIWLFSDYGCTHCKDFYPTYEALMRRFGDEYEFKYTTMTSDINDAIMFGEFAAMHGKMGLINSRIFSQVGESQLDFKVLAHEVGLNYNNFRSFASDSAQIKKVKDNYTKLGKLGKFEATPTLVINNRIYYGDMSLAAITTYIRELDKIQKE